MVTTIPPIPPPNYDLGSTLGQDLFPITLDLYMYTVEEQLHVSPLQRFYDQWEL